MRTIWRDTLLRLRGQLIGWGLALAAYALIVAPLYDTAVRMRGQIEELVQTLPPQFMTLIGGLNTLFNPAGFLDARYFMFLPLILGIFAAIVASGLLVSDEENGTLDLILAHPVHRAELFVGRWLAFAAALIGILLIAWLGLVVGTSLSSIKLDWLKALAPFASLFAVTFWFAGLALLLSMILPSRRLAASASSLVVLASFFITTLSSIGSDLSGFAAWSPITAYQGGKAITSFDTSKFFGLCLVAIIFGVLGLWLFQRRDIRIAGEGGWRLPRLISRHPRA